MPDAVAVPTPSVAPLAHALVTQTLTPVQALDAVAAFARYRYADLRELARLTNVPLGRTKASLRNALRERVRAVFADVAEADTDDLSPAEASAPAAPTSAPAPATAGKPAAPLADQATSPSTEPDDDGDTDSDPLTPEHVRAEAGANGVLDADAVELLAGAVASGQVTDHTQIHAIYDLAQQLAADLPQVQAVQKALAYGSLTGLQEQALSDPAAARLWTALSARQAPVGFGRDDYWTQVVYYSGRPRTRLWVQAEMVAAGVPDRLVDQYQRDAAVFVKEHLKKLGRAAANAAKKTVGAIKAADRVLGKIGSSGHGHDDSHGHGGDAHTGGSDAHGESANQEGAACHWITIHDPMPMHLCVDGDGMIQKGPKHLMGPNGEPRHFREALKAEHHGAAESGSQHAKASAEAKTKDGAAPPGHDAVAAHAQHAGSKAGHIVGQAMEHLESAVHVLMHPGAGMVTAIATKLIGGRVGWIKDKVHALEGKIRKRYGEPAGTAIICTGIAATFAAGLGLHALVHAAGGGHGGGHHAPAEDHSHGGHDTHTAGVGGNLLTTGLVMLPSTIPGLHLVGALPALALAETVLQSGKAVKAVGSVAAKAIGGARTAMSKLRSFLGGKRGQADASTKVGLSDDPADWLWDFRSVTFADAAGKPVTPAEIDEAGHDLAKELMDGYLADLATHKDDLQEYLAKFAEAAQGAAAKHAAEGDVVGALVEAAASGVGTLVESLAELVRFATAAQIREAARALNVLGDPACAVADAVLAVARGVAARSGTADAVCFDGLPLAPTAAAQALTDSGVPAARAAGYAAGFPAWATVVTTAVARMLPDALMARGREPVLFAGEILTRDMVRMALAERSAAPDAAEQCVAFWRADGDTDEPGTWLRWCGGSGCRWVGFVAGDDLLVSVDAHGRIVAADPGLEPLLRGVTLPEATGTGTAGGLASAQFACVGLAGSYTEVTTALAERRCWAQAARDLLDNAATPCAAPPLREAMRAALVTFEDPLLVRPAAEVTRVCSDAFGGPLQVLARAALDADPLQAGRWLVEGDSSCLAARFTADGHLAEVLPVPTLVPVDDAGAPLAVAVASPPA